MEILNDKKLKQISGGASFWAIVGTIAALITLGVGVIDGYVRPTKCNFKSKR